jgi:hypothetical protein
VPTFETPETIFNGALDLVGERPILSLVEQRKEVRWLVRNYSRYVQSSLRQDVWNFALELWTLNQSPTAPAFRWKYAYYLPNGWLRVLPLTYDGDPNGQPIKHAVMSNQLLTNQDNPTKALLIMDRQDPGEWDPLFANLVIARLGHGLAHALTHKASYVQLAKQSVDEAYEIAQLANAFEGSPGETEQHDVIRVRGL